MGGTEGPDRATGMVALLVGALTGQRELTEVDRQAVAEWTVDHASEKEVRALLIKVVSTQIIDTTEFRQQVADAIRDKFASGS